MQFNRNIRYEILGRTGEDKNSSACKDQSFLEILGKRQDGYHEIETVMQEISLYDYIHMEDRNEDIELTCSNSTLSVGEDNLVLKAARLFRENREFSEA